MSVESILSNLGLIANAPEGIRRLREMIYHLAITGQLTEQRAVDSDGQELLKKIQIEKQQLITAGKYRQTARLDKMRDRFNENIPKIPGSWAWTNLSEVGEISPKNECNDNTMVSFASMNGVPEKHSSKIIAEKKSWASIKRGYSHFANGDVILAKITPCFENGKAAVVSSLTNGLGAGTTELHVVRPLPGYVLSGFIYIFLRSPYFRANGERYMIGSAGQKRLPVDYFATRPMPLPPLAEQERIVAKVDELMGLCDQLEAQRQQREQLFPVLSTVCHKTFVKSPSLTALDRIFDGIGTVSFDDLRKTLLILAVRGMLVPQEGEDGSAEDTFPGLHRTKFSNLGDLFVIPDSWATCSYENLTSLVTSGSRGWKEFYANTGTIFIRTQNIKTDRLVLEDVDRVPGVGPERVRGSVALYG